MTMTAKPFGWAKKQESFVEVHAKTDNFLILLIKNQTIYKYKKLFNIMLLNSSNYN